MTMHRAVRAYLAISTVAICMVPATAWAIPVALVAAIVPSLIPNF